MELLNNINVILQIFSNICIVCITLYTAYLQFWSKSIKVLGYSYHSTMFYGESATLQLRNESLSPLSIQCIYMVFDKHRKILFKEYDEPFLVEGRHSFQVRMDPVSESIPELSSMFYQNRLLIIQFTDGNSISLFSRKGWKNKISLWYNNYKFIGRLKKSLTYELTKLMTINTVRKKFQDKCLSSSVRFILIVKKESDIKTIFINNNGHMSEACFFDGMWINGLGEGSYSEIKAKIDEGFKGQDLEYRLYKVEEVIEVEQSF